MLKPTGFTLLELMLTLALVGLLSIGLVNWHVSFQQSVYQHQEQAQSAEALQHWLHWLWRDVQNTLSATGGHWRFEPHEQCLLYGEVGVRVRAHSLQWRPQAGTCSSTGWQGLSSTEQVQFIGLQVDQAQLCLRGQSLSGYQHSACLPWS